MVSAWLRRNVIAIVLAAIAAGIATRAFTRAPAHSRETRDLSIARARLSACLLGEPVSRIGPDIVRLRAIQLAGASGWPKRCTPYAAAVERALPHDEGRSGDDGSRALDRGELFQNYSIESHLDELLTPASDEPIAALADVARDVPLPPPPLVLPHEVPAVASRAEPLIDLGDRDLTLVLGDQIACRFAASAGGLEPVAHCSYPADALADAQNQWSVVRATAAADLQVVTNDGVRAFTTGDRIVATAAAVQASNLAGTLFVWPADATRASVLRRDPSGATTILRLPHKLDESATLVRDQLLWTEHERVVGVSLAGPTVGTVYEVAKAAHLPRPVTCATDEIAAALVVVGDDQYRVAVLANGTWRLSDTGPRYDLHCSGKAVTGLSTDARSYGIDIDRIDCDATSCTPSKATLEHISGPHAVAAIGKDTIVVWVDDLVRGVRGPLAALTSVKPFAIYDGARYEQLDHQQVSATELVQGVDVVGRGASAIVVLHGDGIRLVHVRDGKPERVSLVFD